MKADYIEHRIATWFDPRKNIIVPNVSWGWGLSYEADLVVLYPSGWAVEIEIKCSKSDLKADAKKRKWSNWNPLRGKVFQRFFYAMPEVLATPEIIADLPEGAGVLTVSENGIVRQLRPATKNPNALKVSDDRRLHLLHLGVMRVWGLKEAALQKHERFQEEEANAHPA